MATHVLITNNMFVTHSATHMQNISSLAPPIHPQLNRERVELDISSFPSQKHKEVDLFWSCITARRSVNFGNIVGTQNTAVEV